MKINDEHLGCFARFKLGEKEYDGIIIQVDNFVKECDVFNIDESFLRQYIPFKDILYVGDHPTPTYSMTLLGFDQEHLDRCDLKINSPFEKIVKKLRWGTYGKSGKNKLRWVKLINCSTSHLEAILRTQPINAITKKVIKEILSQRKRPEE